MMAIQAQLYSENNNNLGFGFAVCGSQQHQQQQYWMMENGGCGGAGGFNLNQFCFDNIHQKQQQVQQQQNMQQLQNYQQINQSLCLDHNNNNNGLLKNSNNNNNTSVSPQSMSLSQCLALQVEKQRQEIDHYIKSQNERLRMVLQEQRKQHLEMLLKKIESKTSCLLREKDEEIAKATNRTMELEILLKKLEMESQAWQRIAHENEAMVYSLNNTLEQLKEKASACCFFNNGAEDAESCCDVEEETEEENRAVLGLDYGDHNNNNKKSNEEQRTRTMVMACRGCNSRDSCVLFLPCRHLCACKACEAFLDSCPVCSAPKKASIEALIF